MLQIFKTEEMEERFFGAGLHQPLVICMIAGFVIVNYTPSRRCEHGRGGEGAGCVLPAPKPIALE